VAHRIELTPRARRDLKKLPGDARAHIQPHIDALALEPRPHGVVKLEDKTNLWRIRAGAYRVLYEVHDDVLLVLVVKIADRREAYR
jgi:mRNA interferase RelE/StbE